MSERNKIKKQKCITLCPGVKLAEVDWNEDFKSVYFNVVRVTLPKFGSSFYPIKTPLPGFPVIYRAYTQPFVRRFLFLHMMLIGFPPASSPGQNKLNYMGIIRLLPVGCHIFSPFCIEFGILLLSRSFGRQPLWVFKMFHGLQAAGSFNARHNEFLKYAMDYRLFQLWGKN